MNTARQASTGRIEALHLARLLARFWEQGFSGSLRVQGQAGSALTVSKEILFERGRLSWAASDDPLESIRAYLLNRGLLRTEQWRLAQEKAGTTHPRQTLLDLGFLTARELQDADRERVSAILLSLFNWREGEYAISPSPLPPGTPNLKIDPRDLVLEGIMSSGDRDRVLEEIESLDAVLIVRPDELFRASLSLPVELVELMGKADGTRSVAEICALSPLSDFMISAAFAGLKALGLATPAEGSATAAPPAPPKSTRIAEPSRRRTAQRTPKADPWSTPSLPLEDEAATTPVTATPPGGFAWSAATPAPAEESHDFGTAPMNTTPRQGTPFPREEEPDLEEDDSGTQPMIATPPGGIPAVQDTGDPADTGAVEDDSGTRPMAGTPPGGLPATVPLEESESGIPDAVPDEVSEDRHGDREGETELAPGIPMTTAASPTEPDADGLRDDEIESVVRLFGGSSEEESIEAESADAPDDESNPTTDPSWIYQPSGSGQEHPRQVKWVTWVGIASLLLATGTVMAFFFGGGESGGSGGAPVANAAPSAPGPPAVEIPSSSGEPVPPDDAGSSTAMAAAKTGQPPARKPSSGAGKETAPAGPSLAATSPPPDQALASREPGNIFQSGPFRQARELLGRGRISEAARGFRSALAGEKGLYTVQLALACRPETVTRALETTRGAKEFFILSKEFNGRACYRLLWGLFPSRKAADRGRSMAPGSFLRDRNPPFIAPI
jgi:hypothetical protein